MVKPSKSSSSNRNNSNSINKNKFSVYEFDHDDRRVEKDSQKILSKFKSKNPNNNNNNNNKFSSSPLDKYGFLRFFTQGTKTIEDDFENEPVHIDNGFDVMEERIQKWDAAVSGLADSETSAHSPTDFLDSKCSFRGEKYCTWKYGKPGVRINDNKLRKCSPPQILADSQPLCIDSDNEQGMNEHLRNELICVDSDDDLGNKSRSSISSSDPAGDEGSFEEQPLSHDSSAVDIEAAVIVKPDCIIFGNMYSTTSQLTFSRRSIKLEGSSLCATKRSFSFNWSITDVIEIKSLWCRKVETAMVDLHLKCEDEKAAEIDSRFSGSMKLNFAVNDPQWSEKQQAIESLDLIYKATWFTVVDIDPIPSEFSCLEQNSMSFSKDCLHEGCNSTEVFEDIIYPQGDPDAVSISKKDIELLEPATFINDTIIDFYVKYLEQNIKPEEKHRFHFFNSFFFRKLADLDKDRSTACEGRVAFQRVRKWTRKVNLFEKDYLFIPVNFSLHWSLIVVCHPGEVAYYRDEMVEKTSKVPCILHMDSIRGIHRGLKNLFQMLLKACNNHQSLMGHRIIYKSWVFLNCEVILLDHNVTCTCYLLEEWRERHSDLSEDVSTNFLNLPFITLELPQQENSFDCGLFLLYYVERFLQQAPVNFRPFTEASNFLNKEWFQPAEASSRRDYIKKLIYKVWNDNAHKDPPAANEPQCSSYCIVEGDIGSRLLQEKCDGKEVCPGHLSARNADGEIHKTSVAGTPMGNLQHFGRPNIVLEDILGGGHIAWSVPKRTYYHHQKSESLDQSRNNMSPIEEEEATWEQTASIHKAGGRQAVASVSGVSMHLDYQDVEILAVKSINSLEVQDQEGFVPKAVHVSDSEERNKKNDTSSMSREELDCCVVEDSAEGNGMLVSYDNEDPHFCESRSVTFYDLEAESPSNTDVKANHTKPVAASEEEQGIKRLNFFITPYRRFRRMLSKDLYS